MGCATSAKGDAKYRSSSVQPIGSPELDPSETKLPPSPVPSKKKKNKLGLKIEISDDSGLDDFQGDDEGGWMDGFADDVVDDGGYSSDESDTGKSGWELSSPLSAQRTLASMLSKKASMAPQSPSMAKFKTAVFKSIVLGQKRVNNYIIINDLGEGAQGKVKLVEDVNTNTLYAMKIQNLSTKKHFGQTDRDFGASKEIAIMKKLDHPNVIRLHEVMESQEDGKIYMILEYSLQGPVLEVRQDGTCEPLEIETVRTYMRDVISGLSYLHHQGIVHQDLKPSNLLLKKNGCVAISDFGVSQKNAGSRGNVVDIAGTPAFMAPELQFGHSKAGEFSGYASDMWSVGIILYVFVVGKVPFWAEDPLQLSKRIVEDDVLVPDDVPHQVRKLMEGLLTKAPTGRYNMSDLSSDPWLTNDGREELHLTKFEKVDVNDSDLSNAFRNLGLGSIVRLKTHMNKRVANARRVIKVKQQAAVEARTSAANSTPKSILPRSPKSRQLLAMARTQERTQIEPGIGLYEPVGKDSTLLWKKVNSAIVGSSTFKVVEQTKNKYIAGEQLPLLSITKSGDGQASSHLSTTTALMQPGTREEDESDGSDVDGDIYQVDNIGEEIDGIVAKKPFTFAMAKEKIKCPIVVQGPRYLNRGLNLAYCHLEDQNKLNYMEDRHIAILHIIPSSGSILPKDQTFHPPLAYFGVYDGHGGAECSEFLSLVLHEKVCQHQTLWTDPKAALKAAFAQTQEAFIDFASNSSIYSGSTACVALVFPGKYLVANVGDSRIVLSRMGRVIEISVDHKPVLKSEMERIHRAGGKVVNKRVQGVLGVSRAFGDIEYNKLKEKSWDKAFSDDLITANPDVFEVESRPAEDEFLIIASDGLWDSMPSQKVVNVFRHYLVKCNGVIDDAILKLVEEAKSCAKDVDNITVQVVVFGSCESHNASFIQLSDCD
jgi:[calcium/calmodulin-dependent protein kinase] kinase